MNKSITQIAQDLGVTRQTIYNKLKDVSLSAAVKPYTVQQGKYTLYDVKAQNLIKQAVFGNDVKEELTNCKREFDKVSNDLKKCKNELDRVSKELNAKDDKIRELNRTIDDFKVKNETVKDQLTECKKMLLEREKELDILKHKVSALTEFNTLHNKTINRLEQDNKKLNERLDKAEQDRAELIEANRELTIALKAAQALHGMDKKQSAIVDQAETIINDVSQQPLKKRSWIDKLLRRK